VQDFGEVVPWRACILQKRRCVRERHGVQEDARVEHLCKIRSCTVGLLNIYIFYKASWILIARWQCVDTQICPKKALDDTMTENGKQWIILWRLKPDHEVLMILFNIWAMDKHEVELLGCSHIDRYLSGDKEAKQLYIHEVILVYILEIMVG